MDSTSCIDESTSSSTTTSQYSVTATTEMTPVLPELALPADKLCRLGSGSSVVLDAESGGGGVEAESRKLPSSQYKGVVPQPNGRWGAQIYEKHQRVWLGTFNEEEEAAKAYDIAAQRFRGRDAVINFKVSFVLDTEDVDVETAFLNSHSKAEIVDMLRKHTYDDELQQSKRNYGAKINKVGGNGGGGMGLTGWGSRAIKSREHLFDKAVTPSDVGKLNRLVIPKQHAERNFPLQIGITPKGLLLNFEDNEGKVWRFRYSYWNSSQSYVLTKGWSRFVKEKGLKAGDVVSFLRSTGDDRQLFIEWKPRNVLGSTALEQPFYRTSPVQAQQVQMVRLFGVNIFEMPGNNVSDIGRTSCSGNKRIRDVDGLVLESCKKQHISIIGA